MTTSTRASASDSGPESLTKLVSDRMDANTSAAVFGSITFCFSDPRSSFTIKASLTPSRRSWSLARSLVGGTLGLQGRLGLPRIVDESSRLQNSSPHFLAIRFLADRRAKQPSLNEPSFALLESLTQGSISVSKLELIKALSGRLAEGSSSILMPSLWSESRRRVSVAFFWMRLPDGLPAIRSDGLHIEQQCNEKLKASSHIS